MNKYEWSFHFNFKTKAFFATTKEKKKLSKGKLLQSTNCLPFRCSTGPKTNLVSCLLV